MISRAILIQAEGFVEQNQRHFPGLKTLL